LQVEATGVFFAVTKLFQSNDAGLRRLVYLMIKELSPSSDEVNSVSDALICFMSIILSRLSFMSIILSRLSFMSETGFHSHKLIDERYEQ
jgi:hypothetical protein